jgi:hypothetical protein
MHCQILNKSKRRSDALRDQVTLLALPNLEQFPKVNVDVHALPDPEQVKEVRWPFTHCQILNKSKRRSGGLSRTARS